MSEDESRPIEPRAPSPPRPPEGEAPPSGASSPPAGQPAYATPLPAGYPAYAASPRPRFVDQVLGMRAVVAVALACLIIGGLSGFILGRASAEDTGQLLRGPGGFAGLDQRGAFPDGPHGAPHQPFGQNGP
jgi:uncharacterized membrane protein